MARLDPVFPLYGFALSLILYGREIVGAIRELPLPDWANWPICRRLKVSDLKPNVDAPFRVRLECASSACAPCSGVRRY